MSTLDWMILGGTLLFIVSYGVWKTKGSKSVDDYVRGGNKAKWWTVGLSVMATQASAITFLSTPGQAFHDGMGFVQFYFGLPLAMIIICMVFIPIYHKLKVYTAYEFLEKRFDLKTRSLAAILFLIQRGLAAGITIFAPSIILSAVLGWDLRTLNIIWRYRCGERHPKTTDVHHYDRDVPCLFLHFRKSTLRHYLLQSVESSGSERQIECIRLRSEYH